MTISPYIRELRARLGSARLLMPSVAALVYDAAGSLLLVRQSDGDVWSTPGGTIELGESPADAVVRETWEETGLLVEPVRIAAIYGGADFTVRYPNGDETQYVISVFECERRGGELRADHDETVDVAYVSAEEAAGIPLAPWLQHVLGSFYSRPPAPAFAKARWNPPTPYPRST